MVRRFNNDDNGNLKPKEKTLSNREAREVEVMEIKMYNVRLSKENLDLRNEIMELRKKILAYENKNSLKRMGLDENGTYNFKIVDGKYVAVEVK